MGPADSVRNVNDKWISGLSGQQTFEQLSSIMSRFKTKLFLLES